MVSSSGGSKSSSHSTSHSASRTARASPAKAASTQKKGKATGANPKLAAAVAAIHIHRFDAKRGVTYCNMAVNAYAQKLGYKGFKGLTANQMYAKMSAPGSGWHKATAAQAMAAAKKGGLTVAGWSSKGHGHIAAVIGEFSSGVPAIAQAGGYTRNGQTINNTFGYGSIKQTRANPTYFVHD